VNNDLKAQQLKKVDWAMSKEADEKYNRTFYEAAVCKYIRNDSIDAVNAQQLKLILGGRHDHVVSV
jgi:hypothetical protein